MRWVSKHRPSPAMVVALMALGVALGGTAVAATSLVNGDKLIKKFTLSGNRLRNHTLTGRQINLNKLGTVPKAGHAVMADTATTANGLPALTYQTLTLLNGWLGAPFTTRIPAVAVDAQGIVHFRGAMQQTTVTFNPVAFQLPSALRPSADVYIHVDMCNATSGRIHITPAGNVRVDSPAPVTNAQCFTSLEGVTYPLG